MACRDTDKAREIRHQLIQETSNVNITVESLDLNSLTSTKAFAERVLTTKKTIYALVNNAGIFFNRPALTEDGFDQTFQTNYLGPYLLTLLLLPTLRANPDGGRIINLLSQSHLKPIQFPNSDLYHTFEDTSQNRFAAYEYSKFYLALFSNRLNRILQNSRVTVHCVDPGNVETNIYREFPPLANPLLFALQKPIRLVCIKTAYEGAQSVIHALLVATPPFYIVNLRECRNVHFRVFDPSLSDIIWLTSRKMCSKHLTTTFI